MLENMVPNETKPDSYYTMELVLLSGKEGAMVCTVEESISEHYNSQIRTLMEKDPENYTELLQIIKEFRDDEMKHNDTGLEYDAESVPGYHLIFYHHKISSYFCSFSLLTIVEQTLHISP